MCRPLAIIGILAASMAADVGRGPAPPVKVRIVPPSFREDDQRTIGPDQLFHVVVTNTSLKPIRLWRDWCSWGYFCLTFEATGPDGQTYLIKKKPRGWDKNYPDWMLVPPGDHKIIEVDWSDSTWEGLPGPALKGPRKLSLKAVYQVPSHWPQVPVDWQAQKNHVWTGRAESPRQDYTLK